MTTVTERFIEQVNAAEATLLETGMIVLPIERKYQPGDVPRPALTTLLRNRCDELGWHQVVVGRIDYRGIEMRGWVSIPAIVHKRGFGADLMLIANNHNLRRYGSAKHAAAPGEISIEAGSGVVTVSFGAHVEMIQEWIDAQDPRITKVLIRKGR